MPDVRSFIVGVHHFCDHRCWRCPLAARCKVYERWRKTWEPASVRAQPAARVALVVRAGMDVTLEELAEMAEGLPPDASPRVASSAAGGAADRDGLVGPTECPLVIAAREYAESTWQILRGLRGPLAARGDADGLDACDRLEEMCFGVDAKIVRSLTSAAGPDHDPSDPQSDANGSAKVALLLIEESRQAWRVLMRPGQASGNGAPARLAALLDRLEVDMLQSFPRAFAFIRPGFDTGELVGADREIARAMLLAATSRTVAPS